MRASRYVTAALVLLMVLQPLVPMVPLTPIATVSAGEGDRAGHTLTLTDLRVVAGEETWEGVTITGTGNLRIVSGGMLTTEDIVMEAGSRLQVVGGTLAMNDQGADGNVTLRGSCAELVVSKGGVIFMEGRPGDVHDGWTYYVGLSLWATERILVEDSQIFLAGADGHSPGTPVTDGDLAGVALAGGPALVKMSVAERSGGVSLVRSSIGVIGGSGGDAPDGGAARADRGGDAGGFTAGGNVSGRVAEGGFAELQIFSPKVEIISSVVDVIGGQGGDAGDGGDAYSRSGGGGGGYSGGQGGSWPSLPGGDGGTISGEVGTGGDAGMEVVSTWSLDVTGSDLAVTGGDGGKAGSGGDCDATEPVSAIGGAGGGGYSGGGGGGGGETIGNDGGVGGAVADEVASGGDARLLLEAPDALISGSRLVVTGGTGGRGGTTGTSTRGAGDWDWRAGGGGGSYSAGGGGGTTSSTWSSGSGGDVGEVSDHVGAGGGSYLILDVTNASIPVNTSLVCTPGEGGECWRSDAPGLAGGQGRGHVTARGAEFERIPMSRVCLLSPKEGEVSSSIPVFKWARVHPASANGRAIAYEFQMDDDPAFGSPAMSLQINYNAVVPQWVPNFTSFWRVRALHERPWNEPGPWSASRSFTYINLPPEIGDIPVIEVIVDQVAVVDLSQYVTDPDDHLSLLSVMSDHPNVLGVSKLNLTLSFSEEVGTVPVPFTISDRLNEVTGQFTVNVVRYRHPPYILGLTNHKPPLELQLFEGTTAWYDILVHDVDSEHFAYWTTGSWSGVTAFSNGTLRVRGAPGDVGNREFHLHVADEGDREAVMKVTVEVLNVNDPPDPPGIVSPGSRVTVMVGEVVSFSAVVSDPDLRFGQVLTVTFISNDTGVMRTVRTTTLAAMSTSSFPVGEHVVTVVVSDGQYSSSDQVVVTVEEPPVPPPVSAPGGEGPSMWVYIVASIALFALGFVAGHVQIWRRRDVDPGGRVGPPPS